MKVARWLWLILLAIGLSACISQPPQLTATPYPIETRAPTAIATATAASTATPRPTATPTLVPTPTAPPLFVSDNLRAQRAMAPTPQRGAPCGIVDFFDFPLGAPEGEGAAARWPFGRYSERYNGIHAGEDWVYNGGSLGAPVYSIGHGTVLYAQPLGWGVDQGTLIVRHVFTNGKTILSFYGHLQPESVVLNAGDCVARGDVVGAIGKPRGAPHLHFEIRTLYPDRPGPGYWSVDPRLSGWQPPSEYIWDQRVSTSPGVKWTRPFTGTNSLLVGLLVSNTLAAIDRDQLWALDAETGRAQWSRPISATVRQAVVSADRTTIYLTTISNTLQAIDASGALRWQRPFSATNRSALLPLPGGGVIAHDGRELIALSATGNRLWSLKNLAPPIDWLLDHGDLLLTVGGDRPALYRLTRTGEITLIAPLTGRLAAEPEHVLVYGDTALYRLSDTPAVVKTFDRVLLGEGQVIAAPTGGLILAHHGIGGPRLIALRPDGSLRWEWSLQPWTSSAPRLITARGEVYAATQEGDVWRIDQQTGAGQRVLDGTRLLALPGKRQLFVTAYGTLISDARGGRLVAVAPPPASLSEEADDWQLR